MIYGLNTPAVASIIDRISALTEDECNRLEAAWDAANGAANDTAWSAAWDAAWNANRDASKSAASGAAWDAASGAAWYAAWSAAWYAVLATVTYDLATIDGPYTIAQRDLLLAPWVEVCGMPEGLVVALDGDA